jgi:Uma2 family endonuclease
MTCSPDGQSGLAYASLTGGRSMSVPPLMDDDALYEVVDGVRVEKVMGYYECGIASILGEYLATFVRAHQLGRVRVETPFLIDAGRKLERRPDAAFVSYDRWPRDRRVSGGNAWPITPDLAVEIVSPSNAADEVQRKLVEYFNAGVRAVWVVYPRQQHVYVYTSPTEVRILTRAGELDGGDVIPGFRLPVEALFEDELEPEGENPPAAN